MANTSFQLSCRTLVPGFLNKSLESPLIIANRLPPLGVVQTLLLLTAMSEHLSNLPSFQMRSAILEPNWTQILLWLAALLKPLDHFIDPAFSENELYSDTTNRCVVGVFTFLNAITPANTCTDDDLEKFVPELANSPEMFAALAKAWVAFFRMSLIWNILSMSLSGIAVLT
ncbi:hypothetical protein FB446DRAFT_704247 [Lentinula raphanica]|nr:hypothetical protein FB446DRAFT_704247 [Lentinula raphanica]